MTTIMSRPILEHRPDLTATEPPHVGDATAPGLDPLVDPRWGDFGDDTSSPKQRSLVAIAGSLLIGISLSKLLLAGICLLVLPAVLLGIVPLLVTAWFSTLSKRLVQLTELGAALSGIVLIALGCVAWRPLLRIAEVNFWSLNALAVQPGYLFFREVLRHLAERMPSQASTAAALARVRAASSAGAGIILCGCAVLIATLLWPATRWMGAVSDLASPQRLIVPTLANAIVLPQSLEQGISPPHSLTHCVKAAPLIPWGSLSSNAL